MRNRFTGEVSSKQHAKTALRTIAAAAIALMASTSLAARDDLSAVQAATPLAAQASEQGLSGAERVSFILERMTLEEKLGQLHQKPGGRSKTLNSLLSDEEYDRVRAGLVGSYLHVAGAEPLRELQRVAVEESRTGVPLLFAMDVVHGYRTIFPVPLAMAASFDVGAVEMAARVAAVESSAAGLHWTFAPMIDIARDPRWGRVVEGAGEEPYLGARIAVAQVIGFQRDELTAPDTVLATAKHLGAYGAGIGGRDYNTADISARTLREVYLPPFYAAANARAGSFMVAFNDIGGVPTTANKALLTDRLRTEWGYDGFVVSDWNSIAELINHGVAADRTDAGALALAAGVDMEMTSGVYIADMTERVQGDDALLAALDQSVSRILTAKDALGLFETPFAYHDSAREAEVMLADDHRAAAREVAHKSVVLLRNEDAVLPLTGSIQRIAVIGALAEDASTPLGSWRAQGKTEDVTSLLDGIRARAGDAFEVTYEPGADINMPADQDALDRAAVAADAADLVLLVIGEDYDLSGEARSRSSIALPASQLALADVVFATDTPVAVVLVNGRPLDLTPIADRAEAILETWMLGVEAGSAVADILFGDVSPAGRLPITFPRGVGQAPFYMAHNNTGRPADPDLNLDTARYIDLPVTPLYAFGHGITYTEFAYDGLMVSDTSIAQGESVDIQFTVTNIGSHASDEVAQLYMRDPIAEVARPVQELRGFARFDLEPGESATVTFTLSPEQFAYLGLDETWRVDEGDIELMIGPSSDDIRLSGSFTIAGEFASDKAGAAIATAVTITTAE